MSDEIKKTEPDNIERCVIAAKKLSEKKGRLVTYGKYMAIYHNGGYKAKKIKPHRSDRSKCGR